MLNAPQLQAAYILHTRPYRDTSLLIDAFTAQHGRISLIAKGARGIRGKKSRFKGTLQAFVPLLLSWRGKTDLLSLINAEPHMFPLPPLTGPLLACGFYLNELLTYLLYRYDPYPELFHAYQTTLYRLFDNPMFALRLFEKKLLAELGYALSLNKESRTHQALLPHQFYQFIPSQGLVDCFNQSIPQQFIFSGASLLAMHHESWDTPSHLLDAKRLFRLALNYLLEGKTIRSRELFIPS
ncbi:DNA repair protein RecO [Rickettsiella grylli]|uniref:DNA repair protein RecO n=1 Tax=Rickettsiella grylli TaxID=59196 RepID=A8PNX8_9COXI|nr:DNA repair protein RecO [Rickettsiella grylli]EDP45804.1 DNA repair protein RecO [Rickettsiella grylli]